MYTKKCHVHTLSAIHICALLYAHMCASIYSSGKRLLFGNTGFNSRDIQRLCKIRFINYGMKTIEKDRQK